MLVVTRRLRSHQPRSCSPAAELVRHAGVACSRMNGPRCRTPAHGAARGLRAPGSRHRLRRTCRFPTRTASRVLTDVSFTAREGEVTALVGPSGSGKSTCREAGGPLLGRGHGARSPWAAWTWPASTRRRCLTDYAEVFQDVVLFDDTVMENIRLGRRGATDEEVLAAARAANCDEFVRRLPEGYDTPIGENGARLSGGERQRISIARAHLEGRAHRAAGRGHCLPGRGERNARCRRRFPGCSRARRCWSSPTACAPWMARGQDRGAGRWHAWRSRARLPSSWRRGGLFAPHGGASRAPPPTGSCSPFCRDSPRPSSSVRGGFSRPASPVWPLVCLSLSYRRRKYGAACGGLWQKGRPRPIMSQLPSRASSGKGAHNYGLLLRGTVP